ncbi:hypothetical protein ACVBIL_10640 [Shewanella sp. 125m-7]
MINTLMFAAVLFQADLNQPNQMTVATIDKQTVAIQLETELHQALLQMSKTLVIDSQYLNIQMTQKPLVDIKMLDGTKLTNTEQSYDGY